VRLKKLIVIDEEERKKKENNNEQRKRPKENGKGMQKGRNQPCLVNIGGERVEKNGIITFEGGETFGPYSKQEAEDNTGIPKVTIKNNIFKKIKSIGKKDEFKDQKVMFINAPTAPVDTSNRYHCPVTGCGNHYGTKGRMTTHVRANHPEVPLPPVRGHNRMPKEYKMFTPPITPEEYSIIVRNVGNNIQNDVDKCDLKTLMALVEGVDELPEPLPSNNIGGAGDKYHFTEEQILDSIANNESLTIEDDIIHKLVNELGKHSTIRLAGYRPHAPFFRRSLKRLISELPSAIASFLYTRQISLILLIIL
jgi:hypothetical protein